MSIIANGTMVTVALDAATQLERGGISARVVNMATVHPLDLAAVMDCATSTSAIVTVEESVPRGGLGGAVAEYLSQERPTRMRLLGTHEFAPTGTVEFLFDRFDLTADGVAAAARDALEHV